MFPLPPSARIDTLLLGCTHYPLLRPIIEAVAGDGVAIVDSATATASALTELLAINGLEAPDGRRGPEPTSSSRPATSTRSGRSPGGCSAMRSSTSTGSSSARCRRERPDGGGPGRRPRPAKQPWRDDRIWQAGFLVGSALGAAATVLGRRAEQAARQGLVDWSQAERIAIGRLRSAPGTLTADAAARRGAGVRGRDGADRSAPVGSPRDRAAGRRRARRRHRPGRLGPGQRRDVRPADRDARGRAARPGDAGRRRPRQGDDGAREPLGDDPPARVPARLHGLEGPRPVRPRAAVGGVDAGPAAVRRGEHPARRPGSSTCRSGRSGPGSRCTRRPTPSSSRPTRGSGRTSRSASSASSGCSAGRRAGSAGRR